MSSVSTIAFHCNSDFKPVTDQAISTSLTTTQPSAFIDQSELTPRISDCLKRFNIHKEIINPWEGIKRGGGGGEAM